VNADPRLPCTSPAVATWDLRSPRTSSARPIDVTNATALLTAVQAIPGPFTTSREGPRNNVVRFTPPAPGGCTDLAPFVVPTRGTRAGSSRLVARSADAANLFRDNDRLKLVCTP